MSAQFLPWGDDLEYTLVPDIVVADIAYKYTGLRDARGRKILKRITRPVGFLPIGNPAPAYVTDPDTEIEEFVDAPVTSDPDSD